MFTLYESAARLGHLRWMERALFRVLGEAAGHADEAELCALLAAHARLHAGHADLLGARLPEVRELSPAAQTVPGSPRLAESFDAIDVVDTSSVVDIVYGVVLPALLGAYADHLAECSPVADANVTRSLQLIVAAEEREFAEAAARVGDVHAATVAWPHAGGIFGS